MSFMYGWMGLAVYFVVVARRYCGRAVGKIGQIG
jgi:hypothetical protein